MKAIQRWTCSLMLAGAWVLGVSVEASAAKAEADSLFQAVLTQVGRVPARESLKAFEHVLKADWNYAPAHFEMAKLYMSLNTVMDRQRAQSALHEALRLDPESVTYQLALGDLLWAQGLWPEAREQYEKILKTHPENAKASYGIGYYFLKDFLKYRAMEHVDVIEGPGGPTYHTFYWKPFGERSRDTCVTYLKRSINIDPKFQDAYYQLGLAYFENGQYDSLVQLSRELLEQVPGDKNALLFCGLGYQAMGKAEMAYKVYNEAIQRMTPEEQAMMESVDLIARSEEQKHIAQVGVQWQRSDSIGSKAYNLVRARFWRKQDPLFLTSFNERQMEHYGRIAYANLRLSQPSRKLEGWQTDMGKTHIKFGRPVHQIAKWPYVDAMNSPMRVYPHLENWFYERFQVTFINWDSLDDWRFAPTQEFGIHAGRRVDMEPSPQYVFNTTPSRYVDPYRDKKYNLPYQVAAFREGDSVRVELSYAVPKSKLMALQPKDIVELEDGLFLFNENWEEVYKKIISAILNRSAFSITESVKEDSLRKNYLLAQREVYVKPGSYHVVVEARDKGTGSIGTFRDLRMFSVVDTALSVSDLLLASHIEGQSPSSKNRKDLKIVPNPLRTFRRLEPMFVYFEIYNLTPDVSGRTEYDISYRVSRPEKKEVNLTLFVALDMPEAGARVDIIQEKGRYRVEYVLPDRNRISSQMMGGAGKETEIAVTARYAGERRDDFAYLQVDVGQMPGGVYRLTVQVRDARTGRMAEREALFRVIE